MKKYVASPKIKCLLTNYEESLQAIINFNNTGQMTPAVTIIRLSEIKQIFNNFIDVAYGFTDYVSGYEYGFSQECFLSDVLSDIYNSCTKNDYERKINIVINEE